MLAVRPSPREFAPPVIAANEEICAKLPEDQPPNTTVLVASEEKEPGIISLLLNLISGMILVRHGHCFKGPLNPRKICQNNQHLAYTQTN